MLCAIKAPSPVVGQARTPHPPEDEVDQALVHVVLAAGKALFLAVRAVRLVPLPLVPLLLGRA